MKPSTWAVIVTFVATLAMATSSGWAGTPTWDGAPDGGGTSADGNWSTGSNWVGDAAPNEPWPAHIFQFGGTANLTANNDLIPSAGGLNAEDIVFLSSAGSFTLTGTYMDMAGTDVHDDTADIVNNSTSKQTIELRLNASPDWTTALVFDTASGDIDMTGQVTSATDDSSHYITKTGSHTLTLSGDNTYGSTTQVQEGTLRITSRTALGLTSAGTTIAADARLDLSGGITVTGETVTVNGHGSDDYLGALRSVSGTNVWDGPVVAGSDARVGASGGSVLEISGAISGGYLNVRSTNDSKVVFSNSSNSYGTTRIVLGNLELGADNCLPTNQLLRMAHGGSPTGDDQATFDLNGYDQTISGLHSEGNAVPTYVTNSSATLSTLTINNSTSYSYGGSNGVGILSGNLALVKTGTGTLTLNGKLSNTYTGLTTVNGGTLYLSKSAGNAVVGDIVIDGGILQYSGENQVADTASITLKSGRLLTGTDTIRNLTINSTNGYGSSYFHKLTITDTMTVTGGAPFLGSGTTTTANKVVMTTGGEIEMAANGGPTTFNIGSGGLSMSDAVLHLGYSGLTSGYTALVNLGGDVTGSGTNSIEYYNTNEARLLNLQGGTRTFDIIDGTTTIDAVIQNGALTKDGAGTLHLTAINTFTGDTNVLDGLVQLTGSGTRLAGDVIVHNGGTLRLATVGDSLPDANSLTINSGGLLELQETEYVGGLYGGGTIDKTGGNSVELFQAYYGDFSGTIQDTSGTLRFGKLGSGTLTLSGDNTYSGATTVTDGLLEVNGTHTGGGLYTVQSGGTLGGSGDIFAPVTVQSGATLSPGSSYGILEIGGGSNNVTLASGSSFLVEIGGATAGLEYDQLLYSGAGTLNIGGALLEVVGTPLASLEGETFFIVNSTSSSATLSGLFTDPLTSAALNDGDQFSSVSSGFQLTWRIDYSHPDSTDGNDVALTLLSVVPEPATALVWSLLAALAIGLGRRRRK